MAIASPLNALHQQAEASFLTYGVGGATTASAPSVVETFGELEAEYAALRKGCVLLDLPQRGTLRISGSDRIEFLNRMVTQEMKGQKPFQFRNAFWLNRKGRIDADLKFIELGSYMLADLDILRAASTAQSLSAFVITEDVSITNESETMHRLSLHGPTSTGLLRAVSEPMDGPPLSDLGAGQAALVRIAGKQVVVHRDDSTGDTGLEMTMHAADVMVIYEQLLERGLNGGDHSPHEPTAKHPLSNAGYRMRPAGWHAYNIARIEAGCPLFHIDFGPDSLPAETGLLSERVSFTKGCYLGQEVVARMHALGHPKQVLTALRVTPTQPQLDSGRECQPTAGGMVTRLTPEGRQTVGTVTSSTRSPMLGDQILCFAQIRWGAHLAESECEIESDAGFVPAIVAESLKFWSREKP